MSVIIYGYMYAYAYRKFINKTPELFYISPKNRLSCTGSACSFVHCPPDNTTPFLVAMIYKIQNWLNAKGHSVHYYNLLSPHPLKNYIANSVKVFTRLKWHHKLFFLSSSSSSSTPMPAMHFLPTLRSKPDTKCSSLSITSDLVNGRTA